MSHEHDHDHEVPVEDRWLFLTPEPEAELPKASAELANALGEPTPNVTELEDRVAEIVTRGSYTLWLEYMVEQRELLERYIVRFGADERAGHVVDVINNHHQLALTVPDEEGVGDVERERVAELMREIHGPNAR
jgi:hypothetical protein